MELGGSSPGLSHRLYLRELLSLFLLRVLEHLWRSGHPLGTLNRVEGLDGNLVIEGSVLRVKLIGNFRASKSCPRSLHWFSRWKNWWWVLMDVL